MRLSTLPDMAGRQTLGRTADSHSTTRHSAAFPFRQTKAFKTVESHAHITLSFRVQQSHRQSKTSDQECPTTYRAFFPSSSLYSSYPSQQHPTPPSSPSPTQPTPNPPTNAPPNASSEPTTDPTGPNATAPSAPSPPPTKAAPSTTSVSTTATGSP